MAWPGGEDNGDNVSICLSRLGIFGGDSGWGGYEKSGRVVAHLLYWTGLSTILRSHGRTEYKFLGSTESKVLGGVRKESFAFCSVSLVNYYPRYYGFFR